MPDLLLCRQGDGSRDAHAPRLKPHKVQQAHVALAVGREGGLQVVCAGQAEGGGQEQALLVLAALLVCHGAQLLTFHRPIFPCKSRWRKQSVSQHNVGTVIEAD